jgi:hypothetical protein
MFMVYPEPTLFADQPLVTLVNFENAGLRPEGASNNHRSENVSGRQIIAFCEQVNPSFSQVRLPNFIEIL